ncbi:MAG: hypothetical protein JW908_06260 [Anaerolineales bacterium]|nr:hypothetical protein [Anaerolineales bacterium]
MAYGYIKQIASVQIIGIILGIAYTLALVWYLLPREWCEFDLPNDETNRKTSSNSGLTFVFIAISILVFVLLTTIVFRDGWLMLLISVPLSILIIMIKRKRINKPYILASLGILVILAFVEQLLGSEMSSGLIMPIAAAFLFLAGVLLLEDTNLGQVLILKRNFLPAGKSFLVGCALAVPASMINIIAMQLSPPSTFDLLFDRWWEPLYAFQPGIVEEIWARLLLIPLLYTLFRLNKNSKPYFALIFAIVMAAFIHAAAHYPGSITNPIEVIFITLIYGIPLGVIFVKRNLEQAIAYHFFIDLIRFSVQYFLNTSI